MAAYDKDPHEKLRYAIDWATAYLPAGETINTSQWEADNELNVSDPQEADGVTSIMVNGGIAGRTYRLTNTITRTQSTEKAVRSITIRVKDR